ncbi:diacylglycerol kinase [Desulfovibrio sp.]|uniref:diacylglycerol kinase n=1 Tax=Desulfovibrio TaxID=872 RepID=UPI0025B8BD81|nr:diacylglycerol kinase [Desulfovibrio sp.]
MKKFIELVRRRLVSATKYSIDGFVDTFRHEEAFRLELLVFVVLIVVLFFVPWPLWKKILLPTGFTLVLLAELLNSAIENVCDIIHPQESKLVKAAKDKGSMAVLIALIANFFLLLALIIA